MKVCISYFFEDRDNRGSNLNEKSYAKVNIYFFNEKRGHRGRDSMVVGYITTYAISVYNH